MVSTSKLVLSNMSVRSLVWNDYPCPAAPCALGHYVISPLYFHVELLIGYGGSVMTSLGRIQLEKGATIAELMAAAQKDYEQRIIAALEPVTVGSGS